MFLGLDLGTTNVKAVLVDADGRVVARGACPVGIEHVGPLGVEQDIEEIWSAVVSALRQVAQAGPADRVEALGISSQGGALQMLDGEGRPVGRVISWMDGRAREHDRDLTARLGPAWFAEHVGHGGSATAAGQLLRLHRERPQMLEPPMRVGFVGDVVVGRLCGRGAHDATSLSLALLLNPRLGTADPDLLREIGVTEGQLPDLLGPREAAGMLLDGVAGEVGLPAGIPVSAAVHDQYASALGCAAVHAGDVMFGAGTAWVLLAVSDRFLGPVIPGAFACTHLVDGFFGQILSLVNGGSCFGWALRVLGLDGRSREEADEMLAAAPAGAGGIRFWPFLSPGGAAGVAGRPAGRLWGLRLSHGPGDVLRAVLEGLTFELARYLGFLTDGGLEVGRLLMCGEAAGSRVTPQIVADVTGLAVACTGEASTSAFGAAVLARGLAEEATSLAALSEQMAPGGPGFAPGEGAAACRDLLAEYLDSLPTPEGAEQP